MRHGEILLNNIFQMYTFPLFKITFQTIRYLYFINSASPLLARTELAKSPIGLL
ncbi:Uncharacterised protein [Yersinia kristensenii]|nr:Uncharacterised protein [Yersinia kristensenii]CNK85184.1 Uncharacterised protein [Yersinia kristensenii]